MIINLGRELAFAFGVNLSISKLGSVINNVVSPLLTSEVGIVFAFWFGTILCGFSLFCVLLTIPIDKAMDFRIQRSKERIIRDVITNPIFPQDEPNNITSSDDLNDSKISEDPRRVMTVLDQNEAMNTTTNSDSIIIMTTATTTSNHRSPSISGEIDKGAEVSFRDVLKLKHILYTIYFTL